MAGVRRRGATAAAVLRGAAAGSRLVRVRPGARLTVLPGGRLEVDDRLELGQTWPDGRSYPSQLVIRRGGLLQVTGSMRISTDFRIWVEEGATLTLGGGFANYGLRIACWRSISIGDDCALGEDVTLRDDDEHTVSAGSGPGPIRIGDHVWIGSRAIVLPRVTIGSGSVVGAGSVVTKDVPERCLALGVPARVVREGVEWRL